MTVDTTGLVVESGSGSPLSSLAMKVQHSAFAIPGAFQAAAWLPGAGCPARPSRCRRLSGPLSPTGAPSINLDGSSTASKMSLEDLPEGPYLVIAAMLDVSSLCATDGSCRLLRALNRSTIGPWRMLGARLFGGIELDNEGAFDVEESAGNAVSPFESSRKSPRVDWKGRYSRFRTEALSFRTPFGLEIVSVTQEDEVAYCRSRLRDDLLKDFSPLQEGVTALGAYVEIEVLANPDNLSLAVVDFEAGGRSSVTFSPDTGAVIRERKVQEAPRKVEGAYVQPLPTTAPGLHFEGRMGVYLRGGHLAFFRRCSAPPAKSDSGADDSVDGETPSTEAKASQASEGSSGPWECTGFVTDLAWAEGRRLTPCVAFRDPGGYRVRVARVGPQPPFELPPPSATGGQADVGWQLLDWEADQVMEE